jgi:hypothetical protein
MSKSAICARRSAALSLFRRPRLRTGAPVCRVDTAARAVAEAGTAGENAILGVEVKWLFAPEAESGVVAEAERGARENEEEEETSKDEEEDDEVGVRECEDEARARRAGAFAVAVRLRLSRRRAPR